MKHHKNIHNFLLLTIFVFILESVAKSESVSLDKTLRVDKTSEEYFENNENDTTNENGNGIIVVKETRDTVYVLSKSAMDTVKSTIKEKIELWNNRGYGISGGFTYGLFALRMTPIEEYVKSYKAKYPKFKINKLNINDHSYEPFLMSGGMFYVGIGDGLRLGGCGIRGSKFFHDVNTNNDSSYINVKIGFGGLLIDKSFYKNKWNSKVGGIIGGGNVTITHGKNVFDYPTEKNQAGFFSLEIHGGISYSFFSLFHIGIEVSIPGFFLHQGFPSYTNDYYTINTGLILNIIIGNLG